MMDQEILEEELLQDDQVVGESERAKLANDALRALARATRSYLIYDPRNAAIAAFLRAVKESFELYSESFGEMALVVRPFELLLDGEVVYLERERERSLSFKLFRDGVRRLFIREGVSWEELTKLLEILSIRFVGVRMDEDDVLTLLWKAAFDNIEVEAV